MFEDKDEESHQDPQAATAEKEHAPAEEGALRRRHPWRKELVRMPSGSGAEGQEADKSRDEASAAAQMSSQDCASSPRRHVCGRVQVVINPHPLLSMAARKTGVGSMIGPQAAVHEQKRVSEHVATKGRLPTQPWRSKKPRRGHAETRRVQQTRAKWHNRCSRIQSRHGTEQKHCGWFDSECHTREDLLDHANTWNETVGARKDACKAVRAVWTPTKWGWGGKCAWDRGKPS